ncbi:MAG TPA: hypothetical protein VLM38_02255 [Blastocatellia bacterium]|nr:hypothetical protein [Blastocatellia bacterium]
MFGFETAVLSTAEIKRAYPKQWVAIVVRKLDKDGLPVAGEVLLHDEDEGLIWPALMLGEADDLIHVFYTGAGEPVTAAA